MMANTNACKAATKNSKPVMATLKISGKGSRAGAMPAANTRPAAMPPNTFRITWPASILANNRMERLNGRDARREYQAGGHAAEHLQNNVAGQHIGEQP